MKHEKIPAGLGSRRDNFRTFVFYMITTQRNEKGFVLVAALTCLIVLSLLGLSLMNTSFIEKNIAQNINLAERTFYGADGGTEVGIEMIEWNIACPLGFNRSGLSSNNPAPGTFYTIGGVQVADPLLAHREDYTELPWDPTAIGLPSGTAITANDFPSDGARSLRLPENMALPSDNAPHTNIAVFGQTSLSAGGSIVMAAGYEGKGKGAAGGGSVINYQVFSQKLDLNNSVAVIRLGWRHLVGTEGECRPY